MTAAFKSPRLEPFGEEIWLADGPPVSFYGFPYPTRASIVRLDGGALWCWSPIALDPPLRREIEALGEPRYIVTPNKLHHLALRQWCDAWPAIRLYAPPGLAKKRADLSFAGELGERAPSGWSECIDQLRFEGSFALTEVLFFHRPSRTCLVGDLVQRLDPGSFPKRWQRWLMRKQGLLGCDGTTPIDWRLSFFDRRRARACLARALAWAPERLVIAHGDPVRKQGARALQHGLRWLQ